MLSVTGFEGLCQQIPANINIDQLSDAQITHYLGVANSTGLTESELEAKARQKGLSEEQIQKLKSRITTLNASPKNKINDAAESRVAIPSSKRTDETTTPTDELKVYGSEIFSKDNLTFEPNVNIPTPRNYIIGVGDQLDIDLFGYSDANYKLRVSPEGVIRIPNLGPIKVVGLNFDDAQVKIKAALSKIYPQIVSGKTAVQLSLGQIRTIKVTLIGEIVKPGSYNLSSFSTIAHALYISGGPSAIGSYRDIELIRNGKTISKFDVYDFLLKGDLSKNLRLEDDDIIKVNTYKLRVTLTGAVKRRAIYEMKPGEMLGDIIRFAGGYADDAYQGLIRLIRFGKNNKEVITITDKNINAYQPQSGDFYTIDNIALKFTNRAIVTGAVFHPGNYSTLNYPSLQLLLQAANLKQEAYLHKGILTRRAADFTLYQVAFNPLEVLSGKSNFALLNEDSVRIFSVFDLKPERSVTIKGEVLNPGIYNYIDSMQLQNLFLMAGGFKDAASNSYIEISRRFKDSSNSGKESDQYAVVKVVEVQKGARGIKEIPLFYLEPFDIITVRRDPSYTEQMSVSIEGEVLYPGTYTIEDKTETLSDLVKKAGGFKTTAYQEGSKLIRNTFSDSVEASFIQERMQNVRNQNMYKDSMNEVVLNSLAEGKKMVGIRLEKAVEKPHTREDILLLNGDVLKIPKVPTTVQTFGALYVSKKIIYETHMSLRDVISESGGFLHNAARKKVFVMYANGSVKSTHHFLFFKYYPKIKPGAEVYVPNKKPRNSQDIAATLSTVTIVTSLLTGVAYLSLFVKQL